MKALLIHYEYFFDVQGTAEVFYVYKYLKKKYHVTLLSTNKNGPEEIPQSHDDCHFIPLPKYVHKLIWFNIMLLPWLFRKPFKSCDVVYCYKAVFLFPIIAKLVFKKRVVYDFQTPPVEQELEFRKLENNFSAFHAFQYKIMKRAYRFMIPKFDLIVTLSDGIKSMLIETYNAKEENIYIMTLGVDRNIFTCRKRKVIDSDSIRLVYVSSIKMFRGIQTIIQALKLLKEQGLDATLAIGGSGEKSTIESLKTMAKRHKVSDRINWLGQVDHNEVPNLLSQNDIGLCPLPEILSFEVASPTKVFEYLSMGMVVIASNIDSNRSIITHGRNGLLHEPDDERGLAEAIKEVHIDAALRARLESNAVKSIKNYDWQIMVESLAGKIGKIV